VLYIPNGKAAVHYSLAETHQWLLGTIPLHPAQNTIEDQLTELPTSLEKRSVVNLDCSHCLWKEAWHTSYEKIKNASMIL